MPSGRKSRASRILLAEENSVNRRVAIEILKNLGYRVTAVNTPKEALNTFRRSFFDLVILGCNGSDVDGYEAAMAIRKQEAKGEHIPIVGLTASTLQSDSKRREAASMDDYIAVPIDAQSMAAVINRWDKKDAIPSSFKLTAIDRNMIRSIQTIAGDDNTALLNELIELFLGSTPPRIQEMEKALKEQAPSNLYRPAHSLKGSSGQMGAVRMQQICGALETLAQAETLSGVGALIEELKTEFERASQDLHVVQMDKLAEPHEGLNQPGMTEVSDLSQISPAFRGRCILALDLYPGTLSQLSTVLNELDCELRTIEPSALENSQWQDGASLLLLAARVGDKTTLEQCLEWREKGNKLPIIVVTGALDPGMLACIESLDADFVLEPFRVDDLLLRAHQKLSTSSSPATRSGQNEQTEILVAEDDPLIARFLTNALRGAGYVVTLAEDGEAALAVIQQKTYQLVILDINMPKVDGFCVLAQMRLQKAFSAVPVLMLTSRVREHDVLRAFDLGVDDYVTKPFNPLEVVSRVRRLLKRR